MTIDSVTGLTSNGTLNITGNGLAAGINVNAGSSGLNVNCVSTFSAPVNLPNSTKCGSIAAKTTNANLSLQGNGTGGVAVTGLLTANNGLNVGAGNNDLYLSGGNNDSAYSILIGPGGAKFNNAALNLLGYILTALNAYEVLSFAVPLTGPFGTYSVNWTALQLGGMVYLSWPDQNGRQFCGCNTQRSCRDNTSKDASKIRLPCEIANSRPEFKHESGGNSSH